MRCGRLVQGGHGAAGVRVLFMNGMASIDSIIYSCFSAAVATVCSLRIPDLSLGAP